MIHFGLSLTALLQPTLMISWSTPTPWRNTKNMSNKSSLAFARRTYLSSWRNVSSIQIQQSSLVLSSRHKVSQWIPRRLKLSLLGLHLLVKRISCLSSASPISIVASFARSAESPLLSLLFSRKPPLALSGQTVLSKPLTPSRLHSLLLLSLHTLILLYLASLNQMHQTLLVEVFFHRKMLLAFLVLLLFCLASLLLLKSIMRFMTRRCWQLLSV